MKNISDIDYMEKRRIKQLKERDRSAMRLLLIIIVALGGAWLVATYILGLYYIPSPSMESTLHVNDRVVVNKVAKNFTPIKHGDIIVFHDPGSWLDKAETASGDTLVKRVIGMEGDTVECAGGGSPVMVNGVALTETYVRAGQVPSVDAFSVVVPENSLFVLGDNREQSNDSRYQSDPFVPEENVVGAMWMKL